MARSWEAQGGLKSHAQHELRRACLKAQVRHLGVEFRNGRGKVEMNSLIRAMLALVLLLLPMLGMASEPSAQRGAPSAKLLVI